MQVQTQLSWSERIAATIIQQCDGDGYHAFPSGRWAYVEGMTLMAMALTGQYYGKQEYVDFMKKHMDLYIQPDGSIGTYTLEEYNLDQINQGKNLFELLDGAEDQRYAEAGSSPGSTGSQGNPARRRAASGTKKSIHSRCGWTACICPLPFCPSMRRHFIVPSYGMKLHIRFC